MPPTDRLAEAARLQRAARAAETKDERERLIDEEWRLWDELEGASLIELWEKVKDERNISHLCID